MDIQPLISQFPHLKFLDNVPLAPLTYMKVGGPAEHCVEVTDKDDLFEIVSLCMRKDIPFIVLGGASNSVISDEGIHKLVILNKTSNISFFEENALTQLVQADSGVVTAVLANKTMEQGLTGLEYFIGVPGTIGGAIVNNSHFTAHDLIGNFVSQVEVCSPSGERELWNQKKLKFGYDYSVFHEELGVVLSATFRLEKAAPELITEKAHQAAKKRVATQPIGIPSSGCMYKNPTVTFATLEKLRLKLEIPNSALKQISSSTYTVAAGLLIDRAGLKGTKVGGAQVSDKHATFLINTGAATSKDIEELCQKIEMTVKETYGVELEREVFFIS